MSADRDRPWVTFPIPGSSPPVELLRLQEDDGLTALVRFPPGWSRPGVGHYDVIEEVLFLEGGFAMSGETYGAGDYAWFPAGYPRIDSRSDRGALALAWFSGPTRWLPGPAGGDATEGWLRRHVERVVPAPTPLGRGRLLREGGGRAAVIVDEVPGSAPGTVELYALPDGQWLRAAEGEPIPPLPGPVYCRLS